MKKEPSGRSVLAALALCPFTMLFHAWVLTKLWLWFVIPQFGLAPLRMSRAAGLGIIVSMLVTRVDLITDPEHESVYFQMTSAIYAGCFLLIGFVIHSLWP